MPLSSELAFGRSATTALCQQVETPAALPVLNGDLSLDYPPIARAARVEGDVSLVVETNGEKVTGFSAAKGPVMLQSFAETSILKWRFEPHTPTSFPVVIHFHLLADDPCGDPAAVVRSLGPFEYDVSAIIWGCIRERYLRNQQAHKTQHAFAVGLHLMRDGEPTQLPPAITLSNGTNSLTLHIQDGVFLVPEAFGNAASLEIKAKAANETIDIPGISPNLLDQDWTIDLEVVGPRSDQLSHSRHRRANTRCTVSFSPVDGAGMAMVINPCHTPEKP